MIVCRACVVPEIAAAETGRGGVTAGPGVAGVLSSTRFYQGTRFCRYLARYANQVILRYLLKIILRKHRAQDGVEGVYEATAHWSTRTK